MGKRISIQGKLKKEILEKYNYKCANCGQDGYYIHHIVPLSLGGTNNISNLVLLCDDCHAKIHDSSFISVRELRKNIYKKYKDNNLETKTGNWWGKQPVKLPNNHEEIYNRYYKKEITRKQAEELLGIKTTSFYKYSPRNIKLNRSS